jgi:hypothetical protein
MYPASPKQPLQARELTPELLASIKKRIPRWKPDRWWTYEAKEQPEHTKGRKPVVLDNADLVLLFDGLDYYEGSTDVPSVFDDILHGVARGELSGATRPLSKSVLFALLSKVDKLSTASISDALSVGERQAQRYMQACGIAQDFIRREVVKRGLYNKELIEVQDNDLVAMIEESVINDE